MSLPQLCDVDPERTQVARQWRLLLALRWNALTLERLAELLGVGTRTIRRDLAILTAVGFPIRQIIPARACGVRLYALGDSPGPPAWSGQARLND